MPWGISHDYRFMFIHIPKTAGTTICSSWEGSVLKQICKETGVLGGTHKSAMDLKREYPNEFKKYFKFCVVRNPFDRFVSKFFFKQLLTRKDFNLKWTDKESEGLLPQMYWVTDRDIVRKKKGPYDRPDTHYGRIIVQRMLRYENLETELKDTLEELGVPFGELNVVPHFRQTRMAGTYQNYFNPQMRSLVTFLYREDLERLGYFWEDGYE